MLSFVIRLVALIIENCTVGFIPKKVKTLGEQRIVLTQVGVGRENVNF
jgi:hypothetical protein